MDGIVKVESVLNYCRMQVHHLDPAFTTHARDRANFQLAMMLAAGFIGLLWLIQLSNFVLGLGPADLGVRPRELSGLLGVIFAPLLHGNPEHLLANTPPLLVAGTTLLYLYPRSSPIVLPVVYLGTGMAVWLLGRSSMHLGASGLVYGLVSYILVAGLLRRDRRAIGAALLVCFLYGALVWGVLPIQTGVSWESHLAAAIIGALMAIKLRPLDIPPARRYSWEDEAEEAEGEGIDADRSKDRIGEPEALFEEADRSDRPPGVVS
jgi:membrane associated rhomboid family serine protease